MPKLKYYPEGFSPLSPPQPPREPIKFITRTEVLEPRIPVDKYIAVDLTDLVGLYYIEKDCFTGGYFLTKYQSNQVLNPEYEEKMKIFLEKMAEYEKAIDEWNIHKSAWDREVEIERNEREIKEYIRLKNKYES